MLAKGYGKVVVTAVAVVLLLVGFIIGAIVKDWLSPSASEEKGRYNAVFSRSAKGEFGLWIYSSRGGCDDLHVKDRRPLVLIATPAYQGQGTIDLREMKVCAELDVADNRESKSSLCVQGNLSVNPAVRQNERIGSYSVRLADGRQRTGDFLATFCTPR